VKILVLDDDNTRLDQFKKKLIGHIVDCVETAPEAIELLKNNLYDVVSLDHDLGQLINQPSGPGTGYQVAQWLAENKDRKPPRIIIHSFNIPGAKNMMSHLPEASYVPGIWLLNTIEF
jgi:CheY-like chemotaxis protein